MFVIRTFICIIMEIQNSFVLFKHNLSQTNLKKVITMHIYVARKQASQV
jgi:ABC-type arginine transport system ATPase subunit